MNLYYLKFKPNPSQKYLTLPFYRCQKPAIFQFNHYTLYANFSTTFWLTIVAITGGGSRADRLPGEGG